MKIGQTFIASDVPGSSSNLYSVSGSKIHSLVSTAFFSDIAKILEFLKENLESHPTTAQSTYTGSGQWNVTNNVQHKCNTSFFFIETIATTIHEHS